MERWEGASAGLRQVYTEVDWAATALGAPDGWSPALRGAVRTVLRTRFPSVLFWGPEFVLVYNDAYVEMIGDKHPTALGAPAAEVFWEAWGQIGPLMQGVLDGRGATWTEDALVPLHRRGFLEECYFTFSYSPVVAEDDTIEGVLDIATETTRHVVSQRRLELLSRLSDVLATVETKADLRRLSLYLLRDQVRDLPAVDIRIPGLEEDAPIPHSGATAPALPAAPGVPIDDLTLYVENTEAGKVVWQRLDLSTRPGLPAPVLVCSVSDQLPFDHDYRYFLRLIAASLNQALTRIDLLESERRVATAQRNMSIALQQALLTPPMQPDHLQVAVRYVPAADVAQIGGDWHDAFQQTDGALMLAIGDVAGHDLAAAATMAQARNLTRGIAIATGDSPARVLEGLDRAFASLGVGTIATAIVARVEQTEADAAAGRRLLRWSRAGHPPPVLLQPDGTATLLDEAGEIILGIQPGTERTDAEVVLAPGSMVVLYTDGLVERRGVPLDASFEHLRSAVSGQQHLDAEELCDHLLTTMLELPAGDDDVALMVLHARPEDD
ncbi:serine/threonine-protein phosphatase [Nocardioides sp. ChNu-153]|uniref:PP2C family protein-serine/threonine phosphatase n=1 Tax=unclassified Nocardioides TaxID=2615069 RepID=UPI002406056E|nr:MULTISPECIES: PP2C family protein-serine/threonine phosphatase [unclassified Nocardioides]MDF9714612.1 serine/threonine-protein phosphatase [Nocardioides sp. ChNu-99]MDN7119854.1 serine/threonine-protein phosphatase [Nocardioides sp. ChNu-153]